MPISHVSKVYAAKDAKFFPITSDPAAGPTVYGTGIDVPGLKTVTITGDITNVDLRGDNGPLDSASALSGITVAMEFAKLSLDLLGNWFGGTVVDSGTTPNQKSVYKVTGATQLQYVGATFQAVGADVITGDVQYALFKMILSSFPELGLAEEDYKTSTVEFKAVPALGTGNNWIGTTLNETAAALAAPA